MTSRQAFEYVLIELNKRKAPSLMLGDFIYFINKAISQFIDKAYKAYEINQEVTDDLRVVKSTIILTPIVSTNYTGSSLYGNVYNVTLPDDYLHILGCIVEYTLAQDYKCFKSGDILQFGANKLTADMQSRIINNHYFRPTYKNPYFHINNTTTKITYPTTDSQSDVDFTPVGTEPIAENIERVAGKRYGNKSKVNMEIKYGKLNNIFTPTKVYVDYLKVPQYIDLTQEQLDDITDTSLILEFPDNVCQKILNELVDHIMENGSDPRLQTHLPVNRSNQ